MATDKGNHKKTPEEDKIPRTRFRLGLPWQEIQEVIGLKQLVIIEYIMHLLLGHFQKLTKEQALINSG